MKRRRLRMQGSARPRLAMILLIGAMLWLVPMSLLVVTYGWDHTLTQMSWFFTKAALLTFGGAYAVLPYVYQGAVEHYAWLTPTQMIDGLALGETTPGPLIMVVAFVGFVGAYAAGTLRCQTACSSPARSQRRWSRGSRSCRRSCSFWSVGRWWKARMTT